MSRHCPQCGAKADGSMVLDGEGGPRLGDVSICIYCSAIGVFVDVDSQLAVRVPTDAELDRLLVDPDIQRFLVWLGDLRAQGKAPLPPELHREH